MKRRDLLKVGAMASSTTALGLTHANGEKQKWEQSYAGNLNQPVLDPAQPGEDYQPVETPNGSSLPWQIVDNVKVYHLSAEEI